MNKTERYLVTIYLENNKKITMAKYGMSTINNFFDGLFIEYPNADKISARKLYNPLLSNIETDDNRTLIARSRNTELHGKSYFIEEEKEKVFFIEDEDSEEIPNF